MKLNDILKLTDQEIKNSKIGLCTNIFKYEGHEMPAYDFWMKTKDDGFCYHSHRGHDAATMKNNFKIGKWQFGFVKIPNQQDTWLFITYGEITSIPPKSNPHACEKSNLPKNFNNLICKLKIRYHKTASQVWCFNFKTINDEAEVIEY